MGRNLKEANVHTCAFGPGLRNIFPVTHQMHCFHFTPSLAVTAPRSSFADIQRRLSGRFLPSILISPWWAKTFLMLTPSHSQRRLFVGVKCIQKRRTNWTWIMSCNLSCSEKNYHPRVQAIIEEMPPPNHGVVHKSTESVSYRFFRTNRRHNGR